MNKKIKLLIAILVFAIVMAGVFVLYKVLSKNNIADDTTSKITSSSTIDKENYPYDFTAYDEDGKEVKLSDYIGKPIVMNFWSTSCYFCRAEMDTFNNLYKDRKDIQVLMVNLTDGERETVHGAKYFLETYGYDFPVLFDQKSEGAYRFSIRSIPVTVFIDKSGNIVKQHTGIIYEEQLNEYIDMITK